MKKIFYALCATVMLALSACDDVPMPYALDEAVNARVEPAGDGTLASPYNVVKALQIINNIEYTEDDVYVKGIITDVETEDFSASYGNLTYYISDDGKERNQLEVYRGFGLNGEKFTGAGDLQIGDTVIVCGKLTLYRSTAEFTSGSKLVYLNGTYTEQPSETSNAYLSEAFSSSFGTFTVVTTKGTPWEIDYSTAKASGYNNSTKTTTESESYLISPSVDLSASKAACLSFEYILRYASSSPYKVLISTSYNNGDDPTTAAWDDITGKLTEGTDYQTFYNYTYQLEEKYIGQSNVHIAFYYSCDANKSVTWEVRNLLLKEGTAEGGSTENPGETSDAYLSEAFTSSFGVFTVQTAKGTPWVIDYSTAKASGYDNSTKTTTESASYLISPSVDLSASKAACLSFEYILRYASSSPYKVLISTSYKDGDDPAAAAWDDITGTLTEGTDWSTFYTYTYQLEEKYIGQSNVHIAFYYSCDANKSVTWEVRNLLLKEGTAEEGGSGNEGNEGGSVNINADVTIDLNDLGYDNATPVGTVTLEGFTLTFAQEGGTTAPTFYTGTKGVRMYAHNSLTIEAPQNVAKIALLCDTYNGTACVGNKTLYATPGTVTVVDATVGISDINATSVKIVNDHTEEKGGTQLRIQKIMVEYTK